MWAEALSGRLSTKLTKRARRLGPLPPLKLLLAQWLVDLGKTYPENTVRTCTTYTRTWLAHWSRLDEITTATVADYGRDRLRACLRTTHRKEQSTLLGNFYEWSIEQGHTTDELKPRPYKPKKAILGVRTGPQRAAPVPVTPGQVEMFLASLPETSEIMLRGGKVERYLVRDFFTICYETGLRPWATVSKLEAGKHYKPGSTKLLITKDIDKARFGRELDISTRAAAALDRACALRPKGFLFATKSGRKHDYRLHVGKAITASGLPEEFAAYDLRHACGQHLIEGGTALSDVAHALGHLQITTTNRYVRPSPVGLAEAFAKRGRAQAEMAKAAE